ncbi:hypothetical protein [Edaphocola flava]|uniref:hypothetical protein n=1 Tax=Edaphocola flava TaxID=2499629 RepID=UPI00100A6716|nr:hypothetical protein [Edaphocola flava]
MSKSADIKVSISHNQNNVSVLDILNLFQATGWQLDYHGNIGYLPINDEDYNWTTVLVSDKQKVYDDIYKKIQKKETIGITLVNQQTDIGMNLLIDFAIQTLNFDLSINRKEINEIKTTDFSFYLTKIVPILQKAGLIIEIIECIEA